MGRYVAEGKGTRYGLNHPWFKSRWETGISAPVQSGPGAHPAFCTMISGFLSGIKRPGPGVDHPPSYNAEVKEIVELYFHPRLCLHGRLQGEFRRFLTKAMFRLNHYKSMLRGGKKLTPHIFTPAGNATH